MQRKVSGTVNAFELKEDVSPYSVNFTGENEHANNGVKSILDFLVLE